MAGDWIKFEVATSDKPEVWAIACQLGIDPDAVVGKLLRVWAWFDLHTTDGNAPSVTSALLDRSVGVTGFCKAVTIAGWMVDDGVTISLPNFDTHNGETAKKRCQTAKRVAKYKKSNAPDNEKVTEAALPNALPREDNREDKNISINQSNNIARDVGCADVPAQMKIIKTGPAIVHKFSMYEDWEPSDGFSQMLLASGCSEPWILHLSEFCLYWAGRPGAQETQSSWDNKFLKNVIHNVARREARLA